MSTVYARSTTIHAHPSFIDVGIKHMRDTVMPVLADMGGCAGLSLLVDRDSGRCIATSSWMDEESLRASEGPVHHLREHTAEVFHGDTAVTRWDIALLHRDHPSQRGACVRVSWFKVEPGHVDHAVDVFKMASLPSMQELDGFCSASLLVDHAAGRMVSSVTFDSTETMRGNTEQLEAVTAAANHEAATETIEVAEFELAIAHLHVPEMA
ncbi:MAG: hypothetical protein WAW17_21875 [Rhodococcus sp. (in: high G+C Gram-positive bacteria)]|uniref:hypothetical protein n=1 Tax=Rhodococcus sp. TaxID=1831 RepID=UPI003BB1EB22